MHWIRAMWVVRIYAKYGRAMRLPFINEKVISGRFGKCDAEMGVHFGSGVRICARIIRACVPTHRGVRTHFSSVIECI